MATLLTLYSALCPWHKGRCMVTPPVHHTYRKCIVETYKRSDLLILVINYNTVVFFTSVYRMSLSLSLSLSHTHTHTLHRLREVTFWYYWRLIAADLLLSVSCLSQCIYVLLCLSDLMMVFSSLYNPGAPNSTKEKNGYSKTHWTKKCANSINAFKYSQAVSPACST